GGGTALAVGVATRDTADAHAATTSSSPTTHASAASRAPAAAGAVAHAGAGAEAHSCILAELAKRAKQRAPEVAVAANAAETDCDAVGRHLAELEDDMTHGPVNRRDEADAETCAGFYGAQCASEDWSAERRACVLAAADLVNAHLCANASATAGDPSAIPPALACPVLGEHLATITRGAGLYADV